MTPIEVSLRIGRWARHVHGWTIDGASFPVNAWEERLVGGEKVAKGGEGQASRNCNGR